jgi:hypothetical protein
MGLPQSVYDAFVDALKQQGGRVSCLGAIPASPAVCGGLRRGLRVVTFEVCLMHHNPSQHGRTQMQHWSEVASVVCLVAQTPLGRQFHHALFDLLFLPNMPGSAG